MNKKQKIWPGIPSSSREMLPYLQKGIEEFSDNHVFFAYSKNLLADELLTGISGMIIIILDGRYQTTAHFDGCLQMKELQAGDILFIEQDRWNKADFTNMSCQGLSIIFNKDYNRIVFSEYVDGKVVSNPYYHSNGPLKGVCKKILEAINFLLKTDPQNNKSFRSRRAILLKALLLQLEDDLRGEEKRLLSKKEQLVRQVTTYIQFNYSKPINCGIICEAFGMNPCYLSTLYKEITGSNLKNALKEQRLEHAKYLLTDFDYPVNKIAQKCGYENISYFIKNFKERYNITPKCYQNTKN